MVCRVQGQSPKPYPPHATCMVLLQDTQLGDASARAGYGFTNTPKEGHARTRTHTHARPGSNTLIVS
jgi:hypothetical protein